MPRDERLRDKYQKAMRIQEKQKRAAVLRQLVLLHGIPLDDTESTTFEDHDCTLRGQVWKILLEIEPFTAKSYINLIERGPSPMHYKISKDTYRTFPTDKEFVRRVPEAKLLRTLNAFIHRHGSMNLKVKGKTRTFTYMQGMNVLAGVFLYVMPELDAFFTFCKFVTKYIPRYYYQSFDGAKDGSKLIQKIIHVYDKELEEHLIQSNPSFFIFYSLPNLFSLCCTSPPLSDSLILWDLMIAFGPHFAVIFCAAQLLAKREELLASETPLTLVDARTGHMNPNEVIPRAMDILKYICHPSMDAFYTALACHTYTSKSKKKFGKISSKLKLHGNSGGAFSALSNNKNKNNKSHNNNSTKKGHIPSRGDLFSMAASKTPITTPSSIPPTPTPTPPTSSSILFTPRRSLSGASRYNNTPKVRPSTAVTSSTNSGSYKNSSSSSSRPSSAGPNKHRRKKSTPPISSKISDRPRWR